MGTFLKVSSRRQRMKCLGNGEETDFQGMKMQRRGKRQRKEENGFCHKRGQGYERRIGQRKIK